MAKKKQQDANQEPLGADEQALKDPESASGDLQERVDEIQAKGHFGNPADPTPNERYSLESDDWRTPENDAETAAEAHAALRFHLPGDLGPGPKAKAKEEKS